VSRALALLASLPDVGIRVVVVVTALATVITLRTLTALLQVIRSR
jgi:hypothetical protein